MQDARVIPQDLDSCQRQLQAAWALEAELTDTCSTLQSQEEKLRQENEELQLTLSITWLPGSSWAWNQRSPRRCLA